ncbi:AmmeMemoRadiSam system protein B [Patescibacteria group bacterium]|nr:AmmeMemoRadiSam system protein B [Patescibacteria group bacterium]
MKKKRLIILRVALVCLLGLLIGWQAISQEDNGAEATKQQNPSQFAPVDFWSGLEDDELPSYCQQNFRAGITSHHQLASSLIGRFFRCLGQGSNVKTFIVIGPNHFQQGSRGVLTGQNDWQTPFGNLSVNQEIIGELRQSDLIEVNDQAVAPDHAISYLTPYIKHFFPKAQIVPLLLRFDFSESEAKSLVKLLAETIDNETFILGSVDFSHYLNLDQANENDLISRDIIENFKLAEVYQHSDGFFDTAPGLFTILSLLAGQGIEQVHLLNHSNSFAFNNQPVNTTSYFSWLFN